MKLLLKNIKQLVQTREITDNHLLRGRALATIPTIDDAYLAIENGLIIDYGKMSDLEAITDWRNLEIIDCSNKYVLPAWCDSHSHIVYAGSREQEFSQRLNGLSYEDIAAKGGGILNSALRMNELSEQQLIDESIPRLNEVISQGTGAIEIKSGYGLSLTNELKMLRAIKKLKAESQLTIKATFLGAHAIPSAFQNKREQYIDSIRYEMLPAIAEEQLADYCDVFCERNYFTPEESTLILEEGKKYKLIPKVHANQMSHSGGIELGVRMGARSVDHLEYVSENDMDLLANSNTIATILPGAQFFLGLPMPEAKKMLEKNIALCIASDFNPGSCPSGNMQFMMAYAATSYKLTPEQCINACTLNGAYAMGVETDLGSITVGKKANILLTKPMPSLGFMQYAFGSNLIEQVILNGKLVPTSH